jgi:hypothetical protein
LKFQTAVVLSAVALSAILLSSCSLSRNGDALLIAEEYGVAADGKSDDGPAVARLLAAAACSPKPVTILFPESSTVYAHTVTNRCLFPLTALSRITIDGRGTTFRLHPDIRFMTMRGCTNMVVKNLNVDFTPLPFADGLVTGLCATERWVDVKLLHGDRRLLCGTPTKADGEQAFFSMLWNTGPYDLVSCHYWTRLTEPLPDPGCVRVHCADNFNQFKFIEPGQTRISIPVPGIAHRYGPGGCFDLFDNTGLRFENVELWSAPWFGFRVFRNSGAVSFKSVHIRPQPGSGRLTSTWRDGFHVKGNRGSLLWEGCILEGMNDDAFNISTHCRGVTEVLAPRRFAARQLYPLNPVPWRVGEEMTALDPQSGRVRGCAVVTKIESEPRMLGDRPSAPLLTVETDTPIPGLAAGDRIWQPASTNPDTLLRNCTIKKSCRMQSSLTMENCDVTALLWFYAETIEGPGPRSITLRGCTLRRGRGNLRNALIIDGEGRRREQSAQPPRLIETVELSNCRIYGGMVIKGAGSLVLQGNQQLERDAPFEVRNNISVSEDARVSSASP